MASPSGAERIVDENDLIVTKTDRAGRIIYANDAFLKISDFKSSDVMGMPHSIVRNRVMPRAIFRLLWDHLENGQEVFAYIVNRTRGGDHYWVFAHVTPSRNAAGEVVGFHSSRRRPNPASIAAARALYDLLLEEESRHSDKHEALSASCTAIENFLAAKGMSYDEFVLSI